MNGFKGFYIVTIGVLLTFMPLQALEVTATGMSVVTQGNIDGAREAAIKDAIRQASLQAGANVRSTQLLQDGQLEQDQVRVNTAAKATNIKIVRESLNEGILEVTIRAEMLEEGACPANTGNGYRKFAAIAGFGIAQRKQAALGKLFNIERAMPEVLVNGLNARGKVLALNAAQINLYEYPAQAPTEQDMYQRLGNSVRLAKQLETQFVVSGVVRELSMVDQNRRLEKMYDKPLSWLGIDRDPRTRQFAIDVYLHEGMTGGLIFQKTYSTTGEWDLANHITTGFATPRFWNTDYGRQVKNLMSTISQDLSNAMDCQPYMARIMAVDNRRVHIKMAATSGVRPGDKLNVYRKKFFYDLDDQPRVELGDTEIKATIKQVQPHFVIAELDGTGARWGIQRDDVVIAW